MYIFALLDLFPIDFSLGNAAKEILNTILFGSWRCGVSKYCLQKSPDSTSDVLDEKWTKQNQIRLVEPSCAEVSDLSEVPRFDGKLIF